MAGSGTAHLRSGEDVVLRVEDLVVEFPLSGRRTVHAVSGVSFDLVAGETLGLVGESGCGKSTTGQAVMQLVRSTSGSVRLEGFELTTLGGQALRRTRTRMQLIFQDPISSLNPRWRVRDIVAEGLHIWKLSEGDAARRRVDDVLREVGLDPEVVGDRRPHQFSGGQCQRICIARALVLEPKVLICDEAVSALDVSVQAQILNLLVDMKTQHGVSMLFIAHDLGVVRHISDRVIVMYLGKVCEVASPDDLFERPRHPYTRILIDSIPIPDPDHVVASESISGELPSPTEPPSGCRFRTRCPRAEARCSEVEPVIRNMGAGHFVACHFPLEVAEPEVAA
jgi:peptide/nickel transport system ATP-binding protein